MQTIELPEKIELTNVKKYKAQVKGMTETLISLTIFEFHLIRDAVAAADKIINPQPKVRVTKEEVDKIKA